MSDDLQSDSKFLSLVLRHQPEAIGLTLDAQGWAVVEDLIETSLHGLPTLYGDLLRLRLAGYTFTEIAENLGVSERTVYRSLDYLRERFSRHLDS